VNRLKNIPSICQKLIPHTDYGELVYDPDKTPINDVHLHQNKLQVLPSASNNKIFSLYSLPVPGSKPLFLMTNTSTRKDLASTDPYYLCKKVPFPQGVELVKKNWEHIDQPKKKLSYYQNAQYYHQHDGSTEYQGILGYAMTDKPKSGNWVRLSQLAKGDHWFPEPTKFHQDLWVQIP
jgi:hypothetical protein